MKPGSNCHRVAALACLRVALLAVGIGMPWGEVHAMLLGEVVYGKDARLKPAFIPPNPVSAGQPSPSLNEPIDWEGLPRTAARGIGEEAENAVFFPTGTWEEDAGFGQDEFGIPGPSDGRIARGGDLFSELSGLIGSRMGGSLDLRNGMGSLNEMEWFRSTLQGRSSGGGSINQFLEWGEDSDWGGIFSGAEIFPSDPFSIPSSAEEAQGSFWQNPFVTPPVETP
ncbi:MAG: hypothetical protein PHG55_04280 [Verrucomicrobiota bacterium]|nr:hypothetical protein [Verrucomicrobiota bacterium]